jgi:hypothetical protein
MSDAVTFTNGMATKAEAEASLLKLKNPHLYGLLCIYKSKDNQLWCWAPLSALEAVMQFQEPASK